MNSVDPQEHLPMPQRLCTSCHAVLVDTEATLCDSCVKATNTKFSPERRIDITLASIASVYEALSDEERTRIDGKFMAVVKIVFHVRAMERGEEEVTGMPAKGLADIYDRIVVPGENSGAAILRTFQKAYASKS